MDISTPESQLADDDAGADRSRERASAQRILVIGDSHSTFWTGYNNVNAESSIFSGIDVVHVGAVTAFGLALRSCPVPAQLEKALAAKPGQYGLIVTSFGEIDARAHVVGFAHARNTSIDDAVEEIADAYVDFCDAMVARHGIPIAMWGPPPTHWYYSKGADGVAAFGALGTPMERNYATMRLTQALAQRCASRDKIAMFTILDKLLKVNFQTKSNALFDANHISNDHLPLALDELRKVLRQLKLQHLEACLTPEWPVLPVAMIEDLAPVATWSAGAYPDGRQWLAADLITQYIIEGLHVGAPQDDASQLHLLAVHSGLPNTPWRHLFSSEAPDLSSTLPRTIQIPAPYAWKGHRVLTFIFDRPPAKGFQSAIEIRARVFCPQPLLRYNIQSK